MVNLNNDAIELAGRITHLGITELATLPSAEDVVRGMMVGTLNTCMEVMTNADLADWLRGLADEIKALEPTGGQV